MNAKLYKETNPSKLKINVDTCSTEEAKCKDAYQSSEVLRRIAELSRMRIMLVLCTRIAPHQF